MVNPRIRSSFRRLLIFGLPVLIGVLALGTWWSFTRPRPAPEIAIQTLDGERIALASLRGNVVLVNFWATTCTVCMEEMPEIVATHRRYERAGLRTLALAMSYDNPMWIRDFQRAAKLPFFVAHDANGQAADGFGGVVGTPMSFIIDRRGQVVRRYLGKPDFDQLHTLIEELLAQPA